MALNGRFGELDNGYAQLRTIRVKSVPVVDDGVDGACWEHSTTQRPASQTDAQAVHRLGWPRWPPPGGDSVGVLEARSDKKG